MASETQDQCNTLVLAVLRQRVMPEFKKKLAGWQAEMAKGSIAEFSQLSDTMIASAMASLAIKFGFANIDSFGRPTLLKAFEWVVGELNSALPVDYPYIISILHIGDDPTTRFIVLDRKTLQGWQDFVDPWKVPFAWSPSVQEAENGRYQTKRIKSPNGETVIG